jgi:transcription elongation factor Elf1
MCAKETCMAQPDTFQEKVGSIVQPLCPACGHRIWFVSVSKLDEHQDIRTFKCHACDYKKIQIETTTDA